MSTPGSRPAGAAVGASPPPAAANDWTLLEVDAAERLEPAASVSVLIEGSGAGAELTAAALEAQEYPQELTEVVEDGAGSEPRGDVLVVIAAGTIPAPGLLAAHVRWHQAAADLVSLGPAPPARAEGLDAGAIRSAAAGGRLSSLLAPRRAGEDDPFGLALDLTALLTDRQGGLWLAAALGTLAVGRETYIAAGGPADPGWPAALRRLDLAHRLACAGAVLVPEPGAIAWSSAGAGDAELALAIAAAATEERMLALEHPAAASLIPLPPFRPAAPARRHRRPAVIVNVDAGGASGEQVLATIDPVLAGRLGDLELRVQLGDDHPDHGSIAAGIESDRRAVLAASSLDAFCASPVQIVLPALALPDPRTIADLVALLATEDAGALHVTVPGAPPDETMIEVVSTPALARSRRLAAATGAEPETELARLFGERWVSGVEVSVRRHGVDEPHVTEHGPLAAATDPEHERTQHLRFRDRADDLEARAAAQERRVLAERLRARRERLNAEHLEALLREHRRGS